MIKLGIEKEKNSLEKTQKTLDNIDDANKTKQNPT